MLNICITLVTLIILIHLAQKINMHHLSSNSTRQSTLLSTMVLETKTKSGKMSWLQVLAGKVKPTASITTETASTSINKRKSTKCNNLQETGQKRSIKKLQQKLFKKAQSDCSILTYLFKDFQ